MVFARLFDVLLKLATAVFFGYVVERVQAAHSRAPFHTVLRALVLLVEGIISSSGKPMRSSLPWHSLDSWDRKDLHLREGSRQSPNPSSLSPRYAS